MRENEERNPSRRKGSANKIKTKRAVVKSVLITGLICIVVTMAVCYLLARQQISKIPVVKEIVKIASGDDSNPTDDLKALLESEPTIYALRDFYTDDIVLHYGNDAYKFIPIDDSLPQNDYDTANVVVTDEGQYQYVVDGEVVSKKGIDVSSYQGDIDWEAVKNDGVEFVFIRVAYRKSVSGDLCEDEYARANIAGAKAAGIPYGVYCFTQAITEEEAIEEADLVYEILDGNVPDLPVVCDIELRETDDARGDALTPEERTTMATAFLNRIAEHGLTPAAYYNMRMGALYIDVSALAGYETWLASYSSELYWPYAYKYWQYSYTGSVDGIEGDVDLDLMMP